MSYWRRARSVRLIDNGLSHAEEVVEGEVVAAHGDALGGGGDLGGFVDVLCWGGVAEEGGEPGRHGLGAGYEAFGAEL